MCVRRWKMKAQQQEVVLLFPATAVRGRARATILREMSVLPSTMRFPLPFILASCAHNCFDTQPSPFNFPHSHN